MEDMPTHDNGTPNKTVRERIASRLGFDAVTWGITLLGVLFVLIAARFRSKVGADGFLVLGGETVWWLRCDSQGGVEFDPFCSTFLIGVLGFALILFGWTLPETPNDADPYGLNPGGKATLLPFDVRVRAQPESGKPGSGNVSPPSAPVAPRPDADVAVEPAPQGAPAGDAGTDGQPGTEGAVSQGGVAPVADPEQMRELEKHAESMLRYENELLNYRIQWFLTLSGFLFGAVAFFGNNPGRVVFGSIVAVVGLLTCLSFGVALAIGRKGWGNILTRWNRVVSAAGGTYRQFGVFGYRATKVEQLFAPWRFLPLALGLGWVMVLAFVWSFPGQPSPGSYSPVLQTKEHTFGTLDTRTGTRSP